MAKPSKNEKLAPDSIAEKEYFNRFGKVEQDQVNVHKFVSVREQTRKIDERREQLLELQRNVAREEKVKRTVYEQIGMWQMKKGRNSVGKARSIGGDDLKIQETIKSQSKSYQSLNTERPKYNEKLQSEKLITGKTGLNILTSRQP